MDGLLAAGLGLIAVGIGMNYRGQVKGTKVELTKGGVTPTIVIQSNIKVMIDVAGKVMKPGVYELKVGDRINDALVAAGGLAAEADREWVERNLNRAQVVTDGMKIYIPSKSESPKLQVKSGETSILGTVSGKVSINTAGVEELDKLSGIGPALAGRIIDYREKNGGFRDLNELKLVSGIGEKLFDKIKDEVTL